MKEQHAFSVDEQEKHYIGNYELVRRIDEGGMGEVYLARQRTAFEREVAVKIIRADLAYDETARKRFLREAEVNAHLKHEYILPLIEFNEDRGRLFLVSPYIDGGTLAQRIQYGPMSLPEVHLLFSALVRAVAYVHRHNVVHRDLKPSNVLLERDDSGEQVYVRLIDFGIASIQGNVSMEPELTKAGREVGTLEYMAPERMEGIAAPSNDIFSLGIILYQMLTGRLPHEGEPVTLPSPMDYVVKHCTYPDPSKRFPSADELLRVFELAYQATITPKETPKTVDISVNHEELGTLIPHPANGLTRESAPLSAVSDAFSHPSPGFKGSDYNAPTSYVESKLTGRSGHTTPITNTSIPVARQKRRRKGSIFAFLSFVIVAILVVICLLGYYVFLGAITASVSFSPQVHTYSKVLTITAKPALHNADVASSSVPAYVLNSTQSGSLSGSTTGKECILGIFDCKQVVAFADVNPLAQQLSQTLRTQAHTDLSNQIQQEGMTNVDSIIYTDGAPTPTPDVGEVSNTVTVTMKEQAAVECIKASDVQSLARIELAQQISQQFGANYVLLSSSTQIGQLALQSVDANGNVTIQVPVAGVIQYHLSTQQMTTIQNSIKGMKEQNAYSYLTRLNGIDSKSVVVHVSYGDTLPGDIQQIRVIQVTPSTVPSTQLPTVKPTLTPTL